MIKNFFGKKKFFPLPPKKQNIIAEKTIKFVGLIVVLAVVSIAFSLLIVSLPLLINSAAELNNSLNSDKALLSNDGQILKSELSNTKTRFIQSIIDPNNIMVTYPDSSLSIFDARSGQELFQQKLKQTTAQLNKINIDEQYHIFSFYDDMSGLVSNVKAYKDSTETQKFELQNLIEFDYSQHNPQTIQAIYNEDSLYLFSINQNGKVLIQKTEQTTNFLGEVSINKEDINFQVSISQPSFLLVDKSGRDIYVGSTSGSLEYWRLYNNKPTFIAKQKISNVPITAITFIFGQTSLAVALKNAETLIVEGNIKSHVFAIRNTYTNPLKASFDKLFATTSNRVLIGYNGNGLNFFYSTTAKNLLTIPTKPDLIDLSVDDHLENIYLLYANGMVDVYKLKIDHPEVSWSTYFSKLFYEGYQQPTYTWQSTSADDDFEPKLSLIPLLIGSLKGTAYAMLLVIPLSIMGAIFLSHYASRRIRKILKPSIEMMASVPSVVIGFLAALWLGPQLEKYLLQFLLFLALSPFILALIFVGWSWLENKTSLKIKNKSIFLITIPAISIAAIISIGVANGLIKYFNLDLVTWMYRNLNITYEQQNALVTAIALSFASIPIVFTITDDSLGSVPSSFSAASLALGASYWQTIYKVILPAASPGISAAIILGAARAIGETMIVLMASGNTPITDWSLFNGMRTLSANIAVEIPEAPVGGTLYRTLFFSGLLLFSITFFLNYLAEIIRTRLKRKFSRI